MKDISDLINLIKECISIDDQLVGKNVNQLLFYSGGFFTKQELNAITIYNICRPLPRPELFGHDKPYAPDFASGFVVARSMYETVLNSNYVLLSNEFANCRDLLMKIIELHSLRERIRFGENMKSTNPKLEAIRQAAQSLERSVISDQNFDALPQLTQKFVKKIGKNVWEWHNNSVKDLALKAGFHETWHEQYYGYFSNYAHSNPITAEQIGWIRSPGEADELASILPDLVENFLGRSLDIHEKACRAGGLPFKISDRTKSTIEFWKEFNADEMSNIFKF